jgi:hypothetical protein
VTPKTSLKENWKNETQYSKSAMQDVNPVYSKYKAEMPPNLP